MFVSTKKSATALLLLLLVTLASPQQLVFAQTPTTPFLNTPGVQVQAPANGLTVRPDGLIPIAFNIGRRAISSVVVTVAKADGSGNTTILDHRATTALRITLTTPLASFKLPDGDYILDMAITPNTSVVIPGYTPPSSSSSGAPQQPAPTTVPPSSLPGIYYWRTNIRISNDAPASGNAGASGSGGNGGGGGASNNAVIAGVTGMTSAWTTFAKMMTALTLLAFVNVVVL
ncbi:hypothetical protein BGW39_009708 [Mortierella sp. 14UC]|nr:hypothetical protein BGW39_009708 [Mortierella sp. 14UC]